MVRELYAANCAAFVRNHERASGILDGLVILELRFAEFILRGANTRQSEE